MFKTKKFREQNEKKHQNNVQIKNGNKKYCYISFKFVFSNITILTRDDVLTQERLLSYIKSKLK